MCGTITSFVCFIIIHASVLTVLSFGKLEEMTAPINLLHKISYRQCIDRCSEWSDCHSAKYYKLMKLCKLYRDKHSYGDEDYKDISFYVKPDSMINQQAGQHSNPQLYCGEPRQIGGATLYGNMRINGAKLKYVCVGDKKMSAITECLGGNWSKVDLVCPCGSYTFQHYQGDISLKVKGNNESHVTAELSCVDEKYELRMALAPVCDISTGNWTGLEYACCDIMYDGSWRKVHKWRIGSTRYLGRPWFKYDPNLTESDDIDQQCFYRNTTALLNWSTLDIQRVKLTILKDDEIVVFMTFSGEGSDHGSWFSMDSLLNSSFTDLTQVPFDQPGNVFNIEGEVYRKYLIASNSTPGLSLAVSDCMTDSGWLAVANRIYPCDLPPAHRIMYAKNYTKSRFVSTEMEFADTLEIWIETTEPAVHDEL